jgi:hypothetical protein
MTTLGLVAYFTYTESLQKYFDRPDPYLVIRQGDIGHLDFHKYVAEKYHTCTPAELAQQAETWSGFLRCMQSKKDKDIDVAIIGNSHAEHLFIGLSKYLPNKNIVFYIKGGMHPFIGNDSFSAIYSNVLESKTIKMVIIGINWTQSEFYAPEILATADALIKSGKKVYLVNDVPTFHFDPKMCKGTRQYFGVERCEMEYKNNEIYSSLLKLVDKNPKIKLLDTMRYFCNEKRCSMLDEDGSLLYRDNNHLNILGSIYIGRNIVFDYPELLNTD